MRRLLLTASACVWLIGCAGRADYDAVYLAQKGDYDGAYKAAKAAQGGGIQGLLFGIDSSECRDYATVVAVLVAKSDFSGAQAACADYDDRCAVVADSGLCFYYREAELRAAVSDATLAKSLSEDAQTNLYFRWLMIRDAYEGKPLKRPIY